MRAGKHTDTSVFGPEGVPGHGNWAMIDSTQVFRYVLGRQLVSTSLFLNAQVLLVIMLNPSTADGLKDDATIRKVTKYARRWGYHYFVVVNLFAYRATKPKDLWKPKIVGVERPHVMDAVGRGNDANIRYYLERRYTKTVMVAWGANGFWGDRADTVLRIIANTGHVPMCLGHTKAGEPVHPLYQKDSQDLIQYGRPK